MMSRRRGDVPNTVTMSNTVSVSTLGTNGTSKVETGDDNGERRSPSSPMPANLTSGGDDERKSTDDVLTQCLQECTFLVVKKNTMLEYMYYYTVHNDHEDQLFGASERDIQYCDTTDARKRSFSLQIEDPEGKVVLHSRRTVRCVQSHRLWSCGYFCKIQLEVINDKMCIVQSDEVAGNIAIGTIGQYGYRGRPVYRLVDSNNKLLCLLRGPRRRRSPLDCTFDIMDPAASSKQAPSALLGQIKPRLSESIATKRIISALVDSYEIHFNKDLSVTTKSMILVASFLINCIFYSPQIDARLTTFYDEEKTGGGRVHNYLG